MAESPPPDQKKQPRMLKELDSWGAKPAQIESRTRAQSRRPQTTWDEGKRLTTDNANSRKGTPDTETTDSSLSSLQSGTPPAGQLTINTPKPVVRLPNSPQRSELQQRTENRRRNSTTSNASTINLIVEGAQKLITPSSRELVAAFTPDLSMGMDMIRATPAIAKSIVGEMRYQASVATEVYSEMGASALSMGAAAIAAASTIHEMASEAEARAAPKIARLREARIQDMLRDEQNRREEREIERKRREQRDAEWKMFEEECAPSVEPLTESSYDCPNSTADSESAYGNNSGFWGGEESDLLDESGVPIDPIKKSFYLFKKGYEKEDSFDMGRETTVETNDSTLDTQADSEDDGDVTAIKLPPPSLTINPTTPHPTTTHSTTSTTTTTATARAATK